LTEDKFIEIYKKIHNANFAWVLTKDVNENCKETEIYVVESLYNAYAIQNYFTRLAFVIKYISCDIQ
jgi:hypothetical protein